MLTNSTRFKISIFATIILTIVGIFAYIYNPDNIDKFAFYTINMVLPIVSYVIGRTIRSGQHEKGLLLQQGTRYRTALVSFVVSLMIGIICYVFSFEGSVVIQSYTGNIFKDIVNICCITEHICGKTIDNRGICITFIKKPIIITFIFVS